MGNWRIAARTMRKQAVHARLRQVGTSAALVLLLNVSVAVAPDAPGYASEKIDSPARISRASVHLALPPDELPRRGMLVATGNPLSPLARWIVIDLDLMTIRQATTRLANGGGPVEIESERTDAISADERRKVIASGNEIWSMSSSITITPILPLGSGSLKSRSSPGPRRTLPASSPWVMRRPWPSKR